MELIAPGYDFRKVALMQTADQHDLLSNKQVDRTHSSSMSSWDVFSDPCYVACLPGYCDLLFDSYLQMNPNPCINKPYALTQLRRCIEENPAYLTNSFSRCEVVLEPVYLIVGWGASHPGHFLLEMLPRLLALREHAAGDSIQLYISSKTPEYLIERIKILISPLRAEIKLIPLGSLYFFANPALIGYCPDKNNYFHAHLGRLLSGLGANISCEDKAMPSSVASIDLEGENGLKIFATRRFRGYTSSTRQRTIVNAEHVEEIFRKRGYLVVRFEELSFVEAFHLMSHCHVLAGCYGSALHNSILSSRVRHVLSLGLPLNNAQLLISSALNQDFTVLLSRSPSDNSEIIKDDPFVDQFVDTGRLSDILDGIE